MTRERWRDDWWHERLCEPCKAGRHAQCGPVRWYCECAVEAWLTDFEEDRDDP